MAKVRIEGIEAVDLKLGKLITLCQNPRRPMTQAVAHLHNKMAKYPPQRPGTAYRRTGTLGRRWTHRVEDGGKRGVVGNNTVYAPQVQSAEQQRWMHKGRWQTDQSVADAEAGNVADFFRQAIKDETK
jgi:hypothetical protein